MFNSNSNYPTNTFNQIGSQINNPIEMTNLNLVDNNTFESMHSGSQSLNNSPAMKQIFRNEEITVYVSFNFSGDRTQVNGSFYISNNVSKVLTNIKLNLSVKKNIICKVSSTSGTSLEPLKSLGIKKVNYRHNLFLNCRKYH